VRELPPPPLKLVFRATNLIYRLRLGRFLGKRFLMLIHKGRRSGLERRAALEVIKYEGERSTAYVLSGWEERSQWFRNLQASPPIAVLIGGQRWSNPTSEILPPDRAVEVIEEYRRKHRLQASMLDRFFGWPSNASDQERRRREGELRVVAFRRSE
jgi:deazaflavin-dependent oxidoreductase (nitroreductase family)